jgi:DNA protecting protein dprA
MEINKEGSGKIKELLPFHKDFPQRLREIPDSPSCLYLKGELPGEEERTVAIIGARDGTEYGKNIARSIARSLAKKGIGIVSGMAYGIDSAAHEGALEAKGRTYGILGCGVDICYPSCNFKIYESIEKQGGLLSEYPLHSPPLPHHFVERNRLISGLSDVILVVEAKEKSGTFITVDRALEQGKQVFAVPGRIVDRLSQGCNRLIREGASVCTSAQDILSYFSLEAERAEEDLKEISTFPEEKRQIYHALGFDSKHFQKLQEELKLPPSLLHRYLLELEVEGYCECLQSSYYRRKNTRGYF